MAVTDSPARGVAAAAKGATHLLLRMPGADVRRQYEALSVLVKAVPIPVLIRGRADLALAAGAAGVNLPEADLDLAGARSLLGRDRLLGRSVHSVGAVSEAASAGADFVLFGPVFATPTHPGAPGLGLTALGEAVRAAAIPVLAIGGIDAERGKECLQVGAGGYAAIGLFLDEAVR